MHGSTAPDCLPEGSGLYWVGLELKGFRVVEYEVTEHQKRVLADPRQKANFVNEVLHVREYVELSCMSSVRVSESASACAGCAVLCLVQVQVQVRVLPSAARLMQGAGRAPPPPRGSRCVGIC
jgi:hypothetical protein